jgi:indolepyruvate ferredoxin oxidoreductase, beta subunit
MRKDIIIAGVGGQGIVSIATVIGYIAVKGNLALKQSEVHGMSQRGGEVQSHLRISDKPIASDLVPKGKADMIISVEPMESLRYIPWLSPNGWIITNTTPYMNIPNYPPLESIMDEIRKQPRHIAIDADQIAKDIGSDRAANMVILGTASPLLDFTIEQFEDAMQFIFGKKGESVVKVNIAAFMAGRKIALEKMGKV